MKGNLHKVVGVITKHRVVNYGSFLQAFATQYLIEKMGYKCEIIDYKYPNMLHRKSIPQNRFIKYIKDITRPILKPYSHKYLQSQKLKVEMCGNYIDRHLNLSKHYQTKEELDNDQPVYDIYMTGSDQTWNPTHMKGDSIFMLSFAPKGAKKIAFSASMCSADIPESLKPIYSKYLSQYSKISTRERASHSQIQLLSGIKPEMTLDPTLLLSEEEWLSVFSKNKYEGKKYILLYLLTYSFEPRPYVFELIDKLKDETGLEVYILGGDLDARYKRGYHNVNNADIDDFISLFANASYVVTSSFHGTAFAINFNIPLYSVVPKSSHDNRQSDFLKQIRCEDYIFPIGSPFRVIDKSLDLGQLDIVRQESISVLKDMLED